MDDNTLKAKWNELKKERNIDSDKRRKEKEASSARAIKASEGAKIAAEKKDDRYQDLLALIESVNALDGKDLNIEKTKINANEDNGGYTKKHLYKIYNSKFQGFNVSINKGLNFCIVETSSRSHWKEDWSITTIFVSKIFKNDDDLLVELLSLKEH